MSKAENNGGKTGYYNLPLPDKDKLKSLLIAIKQENLNLDFAVGEILALCPQTLNDLIEHKEMEPWQHECFKANYALKARAEKNGGSVIREINKMAYYTDRGLKLAEKAFESSLKMVEEAWSFPIKADIVAEEQMELNRNRRGDDGALIEATQEMLDAIRTNVVNSEEQAVEPKVSLASKDLFHDVTSLNGHRIIHTPTGLETSARTGHPATDKTKAMEQLKEKLLMHGIELVED